MLTDQQPGGSEELTTSLRPRQSRQSELVGSLVTNTTEIYSRLKHFKAGLIADHNGALPRLYLVKVDVRACFDTINQQTLLTILEHTLAEVSVLNERVAVGSCNADSIYVAGFAGVVPDSATS